MENEKRGSEESGYTLEECQNENKSLRSRMAVSDLVLQGLDRMDIPVHVIDKDYKILYINQKCLELLGMKKDQAMGRYCHDLYQTKNCRTELCPCRMAMTRDAFSECENLTGANQIIQCYAAPIKDAQGAIIGSIEYFPDVTQQKQAVSDIVRVAEEAKKGNFSARTDTNLHKGDYRKLSDGINQVLDIIVDKMVYYESILDTIKNPITVTDLDSRWTFVNKAVEDMLRVKRKDILGKPCSNWGAGICNTEKCGITRLKKGFNRTEFDQAGGFFTVDCNYITDARGQNVGHVEVVSDISGIKKSQKYMDTEIAELSKIYALMAEGDLTPRYDLTPPDEHTKETYEHLKKMQLSVRGIITNLERNIRDVNKKMVSLTSTADSASGSIEDASKGVQQIARNAGKVSENAEKASEGVEQVAKAMQDMSAAVEEITSSMESVATLSKDTDALSQKGAELAGKTERSMVEITQSSAKVYGIVTDIEKQMGEISKIVVLIRELANQTNLLALNAAIEAARAGDAGRGFAVVATEVKSLAQESRSSAEKIEEMIGTLTKNTRNASVAMGESQVVVEQGSKMVTETLQSFNRIAAAVDKVAKSASEVAAATQEQAATTEEITASISEISSLVEQTAKEAGDAAAATEESSAALDEITRMVGTVNTIAVEAMEANKKFRVD